MKLLAASLILALSAPAFAQVVRVGPDPDDPVDPFDAKVNEAIEKGVAFLMKKHPRGTIANQQYLELILLTLLDAELDQRQPIIVKNMNKLLGSKAGKIYNAGLRGLILEKVDRRLYQRQLMELAYFFVESQCKNGQWDYDGRPTRLTPSGFKPVATPGRARKPLPRGSTVTSDTGPAPGPEKKLPPVRRPLDGATGDNSVTQYAILGLFAASRAAVTIPKETWEKVEEWFEKTQNEDGGWGYHRKDTPMERRSKGSMVTAGLTCLIVAKFYQGKDWRQAESVQRGLAWLGNRFAVDQNPGGAMLGKRWHYYTLYGMERVGVISELKQFGGNDWYRAGAEYLVANQKEDGSWKGALADTKGNDITDTCFAILFLKRATPGLKIFKDVATGDLESRK